MFRFSGEPDTTMVSITIDGREIEVPRGTSVAAAVLASGLDHVRTTPVSGSPRGPLCLMGVCYDCLMVIDGRPNRRACQEIVHEGMQVERQHGVGPSI